MIGDPLSLAGALHVKITLRPSALVITDEGTPGLSSALTITELEYSPKPCTFDALILNV